jgi:hypothetical protein
MRPRQIGISAAAIGAVSNQNAVQRLWQRLACDMQSTSDQSLTKVFTGTAWAVSAIETKLASGTISALTAGGIYTAASKGGNAIVGAAQLWVSVPLLPSIAIGTVQTSANLFLSLTVGSLSAATVDLFVYGYVLD